MASSKCLAPPGIRKGSIDRAEGRKGTVLFAFVLFSLSETWAKKIKLNVWFGIL